MTPGRQRRQERGIILIAVLLAVAIMAVMVVATAALTRAGIGNERLEQRRLATHLALRSGVEAAKALILATPEDRRSSLAGGETKVDLGGGITASVRLRDAAGFVDLNRSDPKLIEAVARFSGLGKSAEGLADKITKLRKDAEPTQVTKQPQPARANSPAVGVANGAPANAEEATQQPVPIIFVAVDQLQALLGISPDDAKALGSGLTVFSPTGQINPLAAPDQVLQSIPGVTERDVSDIAMARKMNTGGSDSRLQQLVQRLPGLLSLRPPSVFTIEVTLDDGPDILPGSATHAVVRLLPEGQMPFGTLALEEN